MTMLQLTLLNGIVAGIFGLLAYLMSHGSNNKKPKSGSLKHYH